MSLRLVYTGCLAHDGYESLCSCPPDNTSSLHDSLPLVTNAANFMTAVCIIISNVLIYWFRTRILNEKGMSQIEHYCFEEHEELRRAAVECLCNMVVNEEVTCTDYLLHWHCICSACMIVTLALPDLHPSLSHHW